jgi:signal transduction histidine kinase
MVISRPDNRFVASLVAALMAGLLSPIAAARAADRQKQVLVLFGTRPDAQFVVAAQRQLPLLLKRAITEGVDYYSEYIDAPRFAYPEYQTAYRDFLRLKYKGQHIDLVIVTGSLGAEFMASIPEIFPGSSVVFYTLTPPTVRLTNSTGLVNELHFRRSLDLAVALQPDLKHVFVVSGAGASERAYERQARREFLPLESRLDFTYLSGLVTRDLEARLRTLPARSAVFVVLVTTDGAGEHFHEMDYLSLVASIANAPTYSWADAAVDSGIVGGTRRDHLGETNAIAMLALRVLRGERPDDIPVTMPSTDVDQVDWRQLRRWRISEARVPAGTTVLFRESSVWDRYKRYIIGALALMLAQMALIAGLLVQRSMLRRAWQQVQTNQNELRASYERIRHLGWRLLSAQEAERALVARELHDDINQQLALLCVEVDSLRSGWHQLDGAEELSRVSERAQTISKSVHELSHRLHPAKLQLVGLIAAIDSLQRDFSQPHQSIAFSHRNVPATIGDNVTLCLFRVLQEGLRNASQHSDAGHVWVDLMGGPSGVTLTVIDDGTGFDADGVSDGLGLISMRERVESVGGKLEIRSTPGSGTRLTIIVPIQAAPVNSASIAMLSA